MIKIECLNLKSIDKNEKETEEGTKETFCYTFENKDNGLKITVKSDNVIPFTLGESFDMSFSSPQKKLEVK